MTTVADRIRQLMAEKGVSLPELRKASGLGQPTLHRIMSGSTKNPGYEKLKAIADFFGKTVAQLTGEIPLSEDLSTLEGLSGVGLRRISQNPTKTPVLELSQVRAYLLNSEDQEFTNLEYKDIHSGTDGRCLLIRTTDEMRNHNPMMTGQLLIELGRALEDFSYVLMEIDRSIELVRVIYDPVLRKHLVMSLSDQNDVTVVSNPLFIGVLIANYYG